MRLWRVGDEKLGAVCAGASVGHGQIARAVLVRIAHKLVFEAVARTTATGTGGVAALDDEVGNDAVEGDAIVKAFTRQKHEVVDGDGGGVGKQFNFDGAFVGFHRNCVTFFKVNLQVRGGLPLFSH